MAKKFLTSIDLSKNEIQNAVAQNLVGPPSSPVKGQFYFDSTGGNNTLFWWDGSQWIAAKAAAGATPAGTVTNEAIGDAGVVGVSTNFAREDHRHGMPAFGASTATTTYGLAKNDGAAVTVARSDHTHGTPVLGTAPSTQAIGDSAAGGSAVDAAKTDHKHAMPAFGNVVASTAFAQASANGSGPAVARFDHVHGTPTHDNAAHSAITLNSLAVPTTTVSMNNQRLISLGTPTTGSDATTKDYVDNMQAGLSWKEACRVATTANVTQSSLTAIDGVTPVANDRILCKDQSTATQNGIWLAQSGAWTRALDADAVGELEGATVFVMEGTANADKAFTCTTNAPITPGSTATTWVQFGAGTSYTAGAGIALTGSTFDIGAGTGITVAADSVALDTAYTNTLYVPVARTVSTTAPLTGGGPLSGNLTIAASTFTSGAAGVVPASGGVATNYLSADGTWKAVANDTVAGDARWARKFAVNCAAATSTVVNHALNTRDVTVGVYRVASPYDEIEADVEHTDTANVTIKFVTAPAAGEYRIVVQG